MWIPVARLPPRLRLSALAGAGRFCILGSGAATRKHLPARNRRGLSDCSPQLLPEPDFRNPPKKASRSSLDFKRYVTDRRLAETLAQIVCGKPNRPPHLLLECNPGPGILTEALLEAGAKVVALESDKTFIPHLEKLMADPRNPKLYHVLSVIWQIACEIKVLHMEPWSSFDVYTRSGRLENTKRKEVLELLQQKLYLVQMTPRQNLFANSLTPMNYNIFFHLLKHCFGRRTATVIDHLRSLTPLDARDILMQIGKEEDEKVVNMHPQDFKRLFETIECSEDCAYKWLYDETLEDM
ncbi:dimethyladenosine transferase 2, mitochondrial isoform X2 [Piliocolobus tephrosceles]|uniref:dimethyladenosine transferase 2, mitochondrial isoform X2 n=1 Tax=Piliocolobus tephrosceles TaxID=591936 RepID=UPI000E6AEB73|nr:dimethyladenosine transferase 2, mitochondrial isoform X2 [Piliocolobus tephrosceles]